MASIQRTTRWVEKAYAKINLGLKIVGRRQDGFHEIRSIMQTVDLADELHLEAAAEHRLSTTDPDLITGADNLVMRAAICFDAHCSAAAKAFHFHLVKKIPMGAGLGGGSADAAATLRILNRLYGDPFDTAALQHMAAQLGSDIPFLITGSTALVSGRGELIQPLAWSGEVFYVLVYPGVEVGTAWAYSQLPADLTGESPYLRFINSLSGGRVVGSRLFSVLKNDFLPLIERVNPIVAELRSELQRAGAQACTMSGSGSTVYGIFDDRNTAHRAQEAFVAKGYRSFLCRPFAGL